MFLQMSICGQLMTDEVSFMGIDVHMQAEAMSSKD